MDTSKARGDYAGFVPPKTSRWPTRVFDITAMRVRVNAPEPQLQSLISVYK